MQRQKLSNKYKKKNIIVTGNVPGVAQSNSETQELMGIPKLVLAPENNFDSAFIWAWISRPTTEFHLLLQIDVLYERIAFTLDGFQYRIFFFFLRFLLCFCFRGVCS